MKIKYIAIFWLTVGVIFTFGCQQEAPTVAVKMIKTDAPTAVSTLSYPIENFKTGITLKPFGIYITSKTSPVQPERFKGYHAGADIEVPQNLLNADVFVYAISDCEVLASRTVSGYGGVIVLGCKINGGDGGDFTVLYGHININSVLVKVGDSVKTGDKLAILGRGYSKETDNERKHLHFSMKNGIENKTEIDFRGYVQNESELKAWIDPVKFFENKL
jgi:murein DD-endopeptidase MepM/ murein hydrolase activator NlpD